MADLLLEQQFLAARITKSYTNFKKDGAAKMTLSNCKTRMANLDKIWSQYETNHFQILREISDEIKKSKYLKENEFDTVEELYLERRSEFQTFFDSFQNPNAPVVKTDNVKFDDSEKLPPISLPKFKGAFHEWESFRDLFTTLVVNKTNISNVTKLHHLKLSLEGDAARLVSSYAITEENFTIAWKKLTDRYENKRRLVSSHLSAIFAMKAMKKESSLEIKKIISGISTPLAALEVLKRPVNAWDDFLVYHVVSLLDSETRKQWEKHMGNSSSSLEPPTFASLMAFLENQVTVLEALEDSNKTFSNYSSSPKNSKPVLFSNAKVHQVANQSNKCLLCNENHFFMYCDRYKKKSPKLRKELILNQKRCLNCLGNHNIRNCASKKRCQICHCKHHSSLHIDSETNDSVPTSLPSNDNPDLGPSTSQSINCSISKNIAANQCRVPNSVLLSTALVKVCSDDDDVIIVRALIDQGSQTSFISETLYQRLNLKCQQVNLPISGVGGRQLYTCRKLVSFLLKPRFNSEFCCSVQAFVIPKITSYSPNLEKSQIAFPHLENLLLADPYFANRGQIEILLGSTIHAQIVAGEIVRGEPDEPVAMKTALGWIVSGNTPSFNSTYSPSVLQVSDDQMLVSDLLSKFFALEDFSDVERHLTPDEITTETFFANTCSRSPTGRYIVQLPFKVDDRSVLNFPGMYDIAKKSLERMEKKFEKNPEFGRLYREFMQNYIDSNHMKRLSDDDLANVRYFLPHHGILKQSNSVAKLRTVFNGSAKALNNCSINDYLHSGPNLLPDLTSLILRWRKYEFVFVTDIQQMFRQILIHPCDQVFQCILWRFNSDEPISTWQLQTVTYGMVSSPFLAIRVTRQLAWDEQHLFPLGAGILLEETYMDDTLSGGYTLDEALLKKKELVEICRSGGFALHKWLANNNNLLHNMSYCDGANSFNSQSYNFTDENTFSILGLGWHPESDSFIFRVKSTSDCDNVTLTKRVVLSKIAKLFDPLGWLSPVIVTAKIFMQQLWLNKIDWDDRLDSDMARQWLCWYNDLSVLDNLKLNRWFGYSPDANLCEMHGFADSSKFAYGAVIYLRIIKGNEVKVNLIQAKTKVSPIKPLLTIPRLELCAATLLAKLTRKVFDALRIENCTVHLWSDSTDVLFWLSDHPSRWPIFIANRCSKIHTLVPEASWRHVRGIENPADCISRGLKPSDLLNYQLWWQGPKWLTDDNEPFAMTPQNSISSLSSSLITDCCITSSLVSKGHLKPIWDLLDRFSNVQKLLKVTAYILRFLIKLINKANLPRRCYLLSFNWFKNVPISRTVELSTHELNRSRLTWVYLVQQTYYVSEFRLLKEKCAIPKNSKILKLDPFLHDNLIRVGGRLQNSFLEFEEMHPLILPFESPFSSLLVKFYHSKTLHGGVKLTLATLRTNFWIVRGRQLVKSIIHKCCSCLRYRKSPMYQKLGNLPEFRTRPSRPFLKAGVDYAGPYNIRASPGRGHKTYKGYIALFVCLSTRSVHLELVSGYSSKEFIAAFRRFTARRGFCSDLYSDRGTTFIGADKELKELFERSTSFTNDISGILINEGTNWHFNPPAAPHFGGIWEAAVKSAKHHLRRVISSHSLTFEEFYTLLTQVEACMNSRPLMSLHDTVDDLHPLTPAHFLINSPSFIIPEPSSLEVEISPTERWKIVQQMLAHWWKQWSREYLQSLQVRYKWYSKQPSLQLNDLVLITAENTPPSKWPLARVVEVFCGKDGLVRVVKLKTATTVLERPVNKLILLSKAVPESDAL